MGRLINLTTVAGCLLALAGVAALAAPDFTTDSTKTVATVGDLTVQTHQETDHVIPPQVGAGVAIIGVLLLGAGLYRRV